MKTRLMLAIVFFTVLTAGIGAGTQISGTYVLKSGEVTVTLFLQTDMKGTVTGSMTSTKGARFTINGALEEDLAVGVCRGDAGSAYFEAELSGSTLRLTLFEIGADNAPDYTKATSMEFTKQGGGDTTAQKTERNPPVSPGETKTSQNPLAQRPKEDPFVGTFRGQDLELSLQGGGGNYTGTLHYSGQAFPVQARSKGGNSIEGTFESDGKAFPFSASLSGDAMKFVTENVQYNLNKETAKKETAKTSGNEISDPKMGISFQPLPGWRAQKQEGGYLLGSETHKGVILMMPHQNTDLTTMVNEAGQGIADEGSGTFLKLASQIVPFGKNGIACEFKGTFQGQAAKAYAIGLLSPSGGGVIILAAVESKSYTNAYPQFAQALASSVTFFQGQDQTAQGQQQGDRSLMTYFAGKYYSYTGGSTMSGSAGTERRIMLCPNGNFYDSSDFSASGSGDVDWGAAQSGRGSGRWKIRGSKTQGVITIIRPNGSVEEVEYFVTGPKGVIQINGITFAYEGAAECN